MVLVVDRRYFTESVESRFNYEGIISLIALDIEQHQARIIAGDPPRKVSGKSRRRSKAEVGDGQSL